jgi:RNA recognition motif-containing protein
MKNIYVGNLPRTATEASLKSLFVTFGEVGAVKFIKDRFTQEFRGFGFVEMPNDEEAVNAINSLNGQVFEGNSLRINEARPQENRPRTGGFGDRPRSGGFGDRPRSGGFGDRPRSGGFGGSRDGNRGDRY